MAKKCLLKGEKTAPFLRQKPAKNALFLLFCRKKWGEIKKQSVISRGSLANIMLYAPT